MKFWIVKIERSIIIPYLNSQHSNHLLITIHWEAVSDTIQPDGDEGNRLDLCSDTENCRREKSNKYLSHYHNNMGWA